MFAKNLPYLKILVNSHKYVNSVITNTYMLTNICNFW
jgi:hypothetical protein